ncbi:hypothetical protein CathTA2_2007 [Caldalkalibacillus thermarum TA2.A1]|uniref:DUF5325 family protein n=1 Tax=Caldalkalibacillus thermarum (strain TA2.A1) TaxID=986075 RepID=F5L855_CALTT|nr:DUF5325 family protein [Caldalkalibacillus thermarum]EGL82468.1 hypothetical protein CathTA2_2007 [Caldalkalibacillus thermarum TA2.A1]QZT33183.1 DUF5325 family protein [Caldalkalibacillus thermarum TA2.A1]
MKMRQTLFVLISCTAVALFVLTGILIAERRLISALLALLTSLVVIGSGFIIKKRWSQ